ncbi:hypothetical protein LLH06_10135 [Mucilaginibacter daejeonensis]|uniref:hypothetical protein n=1 Tax=Mucilaginibacter daejeonensis TaxID=398049 RepID=UPI001D171C8A|nr:hypothetical protein [Mucilaginibacter daejeonensis]UEG55318.1 hypothetical protein LLH06_10135 [Mucilaginibacter daejeonensis]
MANATGGKILDFKRAGTKPGDFNYSNYDYFYRGMYFNGVHGYDNNGITTYTSARDIGNFAAGYVAGLNYLDWFHARLGFDFLQSWQDKRFSSEGISTQAAEFSGFIHGQKALIEKYKRLFK